MFFSKCPLRVSLLGGGSDINWFLESNGWGNTFGFALDICNYVYIGKTSKHRGVLSYSSREEYTDIDSISHPIIRKTLDYFNCNKPLELFSYSEIGSGKGLGGSSSFSCALVAVLNQYAPSFDDSSFNLADVAAQIEINHLKSPIGSQDHFLASLGGVNYLSFENDSFSPKVVNFNKLLDTTNIFNDMYLVDTFSSSFRSSFYV